jgi:hypothetical protein
VQTYGTYNLTKLMDPQRQPIAAGSASKSGTGGHRNERKAVMEDIGKILKDALGDQVHVVTFTEQQALLVEAEARNKARLRSLGCAWDRSCWLC